MSKKRTKYSAEF